MCSGALTGGVLHIVTIRLPYVLSPCTPDQLVSWTGPDRSKCRYIWPGIQLAETIDTLESIALAAVDPTHPLHPIASIVASVMLLLVLLTRFVRQSRRPGVVFLCFMKSIKWPEDVDIKLFVYCDIG